MKNGGYIIIILLIILSCSTSKSVSTIEGKKIVSQNDTVKIVNAELEYEVTIIDPGFSTWLVTNAYPRNYHSLSFLESKNQFYVSEWNNRVMQPLRYSPNLYEMTIDYNPTIHYGYEVNYLIYNYMISLVST